MTKKVDKKKNKKKQSVSMWKELLGPLKDNRVKYVTGFFFILFGLFVLLAFVSFLVNGGIDQSKLDIETGKLLMDPAIKVKNWAGKLGALLAESIINRGFGIPSFVFVWLSIVVGLRCLGIKYFNVTKTLLLGTFFILWGSIVFAYFFDIFSTDSFVFPGGMHGFFVERWMNALMGGIGTFLVLFLLMVAVLMFSFKNLVDSLGSLFNFKKIKDELIDYDSEDEVLEKENNVSEINNTEELDTGKLDIDEDLFIGGLHEPEESVELETEINSEIVPDVSFENVRNTEISKGEGEEDLELTVENNGDKEEFVKKNIVPQDDYDPTMELSNYRFPDIDLLEEHNSSVARVSKQELEDNKNRIVETLRNYKIEIVKIKATIGPTVTLYEIVPAPGVRISKIKNLEDDIALSLSALGIRIIAPIPGRGTIGIEVPNQAPEVVSMKGIIASKKFQESGYALPVALGKTISNEIFTFDLAKMPHLLVAGATGQGKSVGLNAIITSLLYKKHPSQLKFVMVDPKKVELSIYSVIEKHYLAKLPDADEPIITETGKVVATLNSLCIEMDSRYELLKSAHVRNIKEYNSKFIKRRLNPEKGHRYLPYIVVVVDEFADLIMTAGKEVEQPIARIAQLARAVGIHMIIATQRPSTNIITGVIKANFPARIAFKVASMIDSRTILDSPGANQLIGRGDMLVSTGSELTRVQCAFVDTPEVDAVTEHISRQQGYSTAMLLPEFIAESGGSDNGDVDLGKKDPLFEDAARLVVSSQQGSTSSIQRRFSIGYNRAGRIIDQLEAAGIVGPFEGSKARQVLVPDEYSLEQMFRDF
jgi:S-DNA-T family DNA segregation ATPase FtsK/SpoIIIE